MALFDFDGSSEGGGDDDEKDNDKDDENGMQGSSLMRLSLSPIENRLTRTYRAYRTVSFGLFRFCFRSKTRSAAVCY